MLRRIYNFGYYCDLLSGWKETHSVNDPYWSLSYRERKHEENLSHGRSRVHKEKREIALLLDVHALDGISDETCTLFINQVDFIRRYFKASKARIVVSSYVQFPTYLKPFLDIFSKYIKPGIVVDDAYFCYGTYNFGEDKVKEQYSDATFDPFSSFEKKYLERRDGKQTVWFAVADDQLDKDLYKEYQKGKASFFL